MWTNRHRRPGHHAARAGDAVLRRVPGAGQPASRHRAAVRAGAGPGGGVRPDDAALDRCLGTAARGVHDRLGGGRVRAARCGERAAGTARGRPRPVLAGREEVLIVHCGRLSVEKKPERSIAALEDLRLAGLPAVVVGARGGPLRARVAPAAERRAAARQRAEEFGWPAAVLRPSLAAVVAGVNDTLRRGFDAARVGAALAHTVGALSAAGATVLTIRLPDPGRMSGCRARW